MAKEMNLEDWNNMKIGEFIVQTQALGSNIYTMGQHITNQKSEKEIRELQTLCHGNIDKIKKIIDELVDSGVEENKKLKGKN